MPKRLISLAASVLLSLAISGTAGAEPAIPSFWDAKEQLVTPPADKIGQVRFLTTIDFPPFNYVDDGGRLAGFNVDLANAICRVLQIEDRCSIQGLPWDELETALLSGAGDAIIAGMRPSREKRKTLLFSRSYLLFPARFVVRIEQDLPAPVTRSIEGKRVGVIAGSAHEAMLRDYFPGAKVVTFSRAEWMYGDMKEGRIDASFGDGMRHSFWIASAESNNCCKFAGGPYVSDRYLGDGLKIVTKKENAQLNDAFNFAFRELYAQGTYAELYLRYFPVSFF